MTAFELGVPGFKPWVWHVRAPDFVEYDGQVDGYSNANAQLLDGDVGQWSLTLPVDNLSVPLLLTEGAGVVVRADGRSDVLASGRVISELTQYDTGAGTVTVSGPTDEFELASEVAWADPTKGLNDLTGNNPTSGAMDTRTGVAETVLLAYIKANMGTTAFHAGGVDRRRTYLTVPTTGGRGTSGTYQAAFTQLLDIAKNICRTGGITWRILQSGSGLAVVIRARADVSDNVVFSRAEGSIKSASFKRQGPAVTQGLTISDDGTTRTFGLVTDATAETLWGYRFVAVGDGPSSVFADLTDAAGELIAAGVETAGASVEAVVFPDGPQYGVDYFLGDTVTVVDRSGASVTDRLAQMIYDHQQGKGPTLTPSAGFALTDQDSALVPVIRNIFEQLRALTRRP